MMLEVKGRMTSERFILCRVSKHRTGRKGAGNAVSLGGLTSPSGSGTRRGLWRAFEWANTASEHKPGKLDRTARLSPANRKLEKVGCRIEAALIALI